MRKAVDERAIRVDSQDHELVMMAIGILLDSAHEIFV